jgi:hypothetical protein
MNPPRYSHIPLGWIIKYRPNSKRTRVYLDTFEECLNYLATKGFYVKEAKKNSRHIYKNGSIISCGKVIGFAKTEELAKIDLKKKSLNFLAKKFGVIPQQGIIRGILEMDEFKRFIYLNNLNNKGEGK